MPDQSSTPLPKPHANRGASFEPLYEVAPRPGERRGGDLPSPLDRYGPTLAVALRPDRPTVIVNFVESLDGVVTLDPTHGSGAEVSGFSEPDRFVMGLLRSLADVIVVGAGTLRAAAKHHWTVSHVNREYADAYHTWRADLGLAPEPVTIVVTGSGQLPPDHPALADTVTQPIVLAPPEAVADARATVPDGVRVVAGSRSGSVSAADAVRVAAGEGARLILCEGGPHLMGTFVREELVDELFLTLAPQLVGRDRDDGERYGLLEGVALGVADAPWARLVSVRRSVDHLFLRYAFGGSPE
jgi:riboflavin biosynthesis pyrimidine reductase